MRDHVYNKVLSSGECAAEIQERNDALAPLWHAGTALNQGESDTGFRGLT
jgi:hypothetical protein